MTSHPIATKTISSKLALMGNGDGPSLLRGPQSQQQGGALVGGRAVN